ncbi:integral membrane protein [Aspergillus sclerotialis]|uniref:Integral membrane protein n=1 Tax=Aspergillus sclerotialis TaxID=2070753 RepID=A0A3A2ZBF4_9EURO|nr:integral membrane protein [Aspergillus sclerotialis]
MLLRKFFIFIFLSLVTATAAASDSDSERPQCAVSCRHQTFANSTTSCSFTDTACLCADKQYQSELVDCVKKTCTTRESLTAQRLRFRECKIPQHQGYPVADPATLAPLVLGTVLFAIRIAAKFMGLGGGWGPDDYTIIVSWCLAVVIFGLNASMVHYGFSHHMWDIVPLDNITKAYKRFYAYVLVYKIQISLAKISVCLFLLRIFRSTTFRYITYTMMGINTAIAIAWVFGDAFRCQPIHLAWTGWENAEPGKCINFNQSTIANAFVNIIVDAAMVVMPMYEVTKLSLSIRKKLGVILMFAVGLVLTVVGILRAVVLYQHHRWNNDPTVTLAPVNHWSTIEVQITIVCACLPITRAMLVRFFPGIAGVSGERSYPYPTGGTGGRSNRAAFGSRQAGDSHISKTVSYSVNYASNPRRTSSDDMVHLVEVGPSHDK